MDVAEAAPRKQEASHSALDPADRPARSVTPMVVVARDPYGACHDQAVRAVRYAAE